VPGDVPVMNQQEFADNPATAKAPTSPTAEALFIQASPAVLRVRVQNRDGRTITHGSGFVASSKGLVVTNYHVVEDAKIAHVGFPDKTVVNVEGALALDKEADLAILKIAGSLKVEPLKLADELPPVGTKAYAIGTPLGMFANTLSDG